jgi:DNA ligase-1
MIKKPMKAPSKSITDVQVMDLINEHGYLYCSPKIDGIRAVIMDETVYSSTLKPIKNEYIQKVLGRDYMNGLDGEIVVGSPNARNVFNQTTGPVRRVKGTPNFKFCIFDDFTNKNVPYEQRWVLGEPRFSDFGRLTKCQRITQTKINSLELFLDYEKYCIKQGFEGIMVRTPTGIYKEGRATLREENVYKRKPVVDTEAIIVGFVEEMENKNVKTKNELGQSERSSHKENKVGKGTLGALILKAKEWDEAFNCGTGIGLTKERRQLIWDNRDEYLHKCVTFKYQEVGSIGAPRQPILKGMRDKDDITDW